MRVQPIGSVFLTTYIRESFKELNELIFQSPIAEARSSYRDTIIVPLHRDDGDGNHKRRGKRWHRHGDGDGDGVDFTLILAEKRHSPFLANLLKIRSNPDVTIVVGEKSQDCDDACAKVRWGSGW